MDEGSKRAKVPANPTKRREMAERCAKLHASRNRTDTAAYGRAYAAVMNGMLDEEDFKSGGVSW